MSRLNHDSSNISKKSDKTTTRTEISIALFLNAIILRKKYFIFFIAMMSIGSVIRGLLNIPTYTATAVISVQVPKRNPLLELSGETTADTAIDLIKKYTKYLKSTSYYLSVAENLKFKTNYKSLNLLSPREVKPTKRVFWKFLFEANKASQKESTSYDFDLPEPESISVQSLAGIIQEFTYIDTDDVGSIILNVTSLDPYTSMILVNAEAESFINLSSSHDREEVTEIRNFLEAEVTKLSDQLKLTELELIDFKKKNNITVIDKDHKGQEHRLEQIDMDLENANLHFHQNSILLAFYQKKIHEIDNQLLASNLSKDSGPSATQIQQILAVLRKQVDTLNQQKSLLLSQGFNADHWKVAEVAKSIFLLNERIKETMAEQTATVSNEPTFDVATVRKKIADLINENKLLEIQISTMKVNREKYVQKLQDLPMEEQHFLDISRKTELQFELYSNLRKKLQEVEVQRISTNSKINISELSDLPGPSPKPSFIISLIFSIAIGTFLAIALTLLLEMIDTTVKQKNDLEEMGLFVLTEIQKILAESDPQGGRTFKDFEQTLICKNKPESSAAMSFKFLRTQLKHPPLEEKPPKVILITSPSRSEGKSWISANLAICNSQLNTGGKTVILDCNFRNPALQYYFNYSTKLGMTSLLTMRSLLEDVVIHDKNLNLDIIPSGSSYGNPTELFGDEKFGLLIEYLKSEYDTIIIDSPAILSVVDPTILATHADLIIMVTKFRETKKAAIMAAQEKILQVCHKRIYAVINSVNLATELTGMFFRNPVLKIRVGSNTFGNRQSLPFRSVADTIQDIEDEKT